MHERSCHCKNCQAMQMKYLENRYPDLDHESNMPFATAIVRPQNSVRKTFDPSEALAKGTLFPELYQAHWR